MARTKAKAYREQSFDHLHGLAGISDDQIAEHLKLYSGYVKQVNSLNQTLEHAGRVGVGVWPGGPVWKTSLWARHHKHT